MQANDAQQTVPSTQMVMHLSGDSDFSDSTQYANNAAADKVNIDAQTKKFDSGSFAFSGQEKTSMKVTPTNGMQFATGDFTVAAWVCPKVLSGMQILFWYDGNTPGTPQWWCRIKESQLQFNVASDGSETSVSTAASALSVGQ